METAAYREQANDERELPSGQEPTLARLYELAKQHYRTIKDNEAHLFEELRELLDEQGAELHRLSQLVDSGTSLASIASAIQAAQSRNTVLKRKYDMTDPTTDEGSEVEPDMPARKPEKVFVRQFWKRKVDAGLYEEFQETAGRSKPGVRPTVITG
ncbi:uncharacterized protein BYT42DRAFT_604090 [Radiomyces spectabilis]|uniref:uncharacterized protein n=1 Tax=Radiomyces spectabilis TaxID=64574 RepID=UPI00222020A7|nr:uncharacterized protein BYT42DRAFT_604090 [Radiomyces spectabilis]KAI8381045.1 hypothetical protein BYT42DRAFT_604090 [Radiomyces spectabilis]